MRLTYILLIIIFFHGCDPGPNANFILVVPEKGLTEGPVRIVLPEYFRKGSVLTITDLVSKKKYPLQRLNENESVFIFDQSLPPGESRKYFIDDIPSSSASIVKVREDINEIRINVNDKPVLNYHKTIVSPPPNTPQYYQRSGFVHPLYSPSGQVITDGMPEGHAHQHGLFFAWVNTTFKGQDVDFWNQQDQTGTIRHASIKDVSEGPVFSSFTAQLEHLAFVGTDTIRALEEEWTVRVYISEDPFIIDFESRQRCAGADTLFVNQYHYGGLGIRGSAEWNDLGFNQPEENPTVNFIGKKGKGGFLTNEGKTRVGGNHSQPDWVNFYGTIKGQPVGLIAMIHPDNFRSPQYVRIHPIMPYFCFTPTVEKGFVIAPGDVFTSRYRLFLHDKQPLSDEIDAWFQAYKSVNEWIED